MNKQFMYILVILAVIFLTVLILTQSQSKETITGTPLPTQALSQGSSQAQPGNGRQVAGENIKQYPAPPEMQIDSAKAYTAIIKTTEGDITVELDPKDTPVTVNNFVFLARDGFYNNTIFHRVIAGFMIQGGDPLGNGTGGPGYQFEDEPVTKDYTRGTIAMANSGPDTNGSQFFIMHQDYELPKDYVIFGRVTEGLEVVDKIASAETRMGGDGAMSAPVNPVAVQSVEIIER